MIFVGPRPLKMGERAFWPSCFFFNDTATTEIYPLSLHDALPIYLCTVVGEIDPVLLVIARDYARGNVGSAVLWRSEEHTSELQSPDHLVCRLLLEKKKTRFGCKRQATESAYLFAMY